MNLSLLYEYNKISLLPMEKNLNKTDKKDHLYNHNLILNEIYKTIFKSKNIREIFSHLKRELIKIIPLEDIFGAFLWKKEKWYGNFYFSDEIKNRQKEREKFIMEKIEEKFGLKLNSKNFTLTFFLDPYKKAPKFNKENVAVIVINHTDGVEKKGIIIFQLRNKPDSHTRKFLLNLIKEVEHYIWLLISYYLLKKDIEKDYLTSLFNRQKLDEKLKKEIIRHKRYNQPLSIIMLDIDHFKKINDTYGHQAGDLVLKELGNFLKKTIRTSDIPARFGGEEFCIILPHTNLTQAIALAERLRNLIKKKKFGKNGEKINITVSMGIATLNGESNVEELIEKADKALYKAKFQGRDTVCWEEIA